jgi:hypothetical protein
MNRPVACISAVALVSLCFAYFVGDRLVVNGKSVPGTTISQGGQVYVPVSALKAAGFKVVSSGGTLTINSENDEPGQMQTDAMEAGVNQWLNNGAFRMRVVEVKPYTDLNGARHCVKVTMEIRNVSSTQMIISDAGVQQALTLYDSKGNAPEASLAEWNNNFLFKSLAPAAGSTGDVNFYYPVNLDESKIGVPDRLLVQIKPDPSLLKARGLKITVKQPSMRFLLQK